MTRPPRRYVPALEYHWLTPAYDALIRRTMPEEAFRRRLVSQARIGDGHAVLDLGCGTATLALVVKRAHPGARVTGVDGDPEILRIAARKVEAEQMDVTLDTAMAYALPYPDRAFDRVLSSLVFHHLRADEKRHALAECHRVLRPGGELHIADWGAPHNPLMWLASWSVRLFDGLAVTADNVRGHLPRLISQAGFADVEETSRFATVFGTLRLWRARRPGPA